MLSTKQLLRCPRCNFHYNFNNKKKFGWYRIYLTPCPKAELNVNMTLVCRKCGYENKFTIQKTQIKDHMAMVK